MTPEVRHATEDDLGGILAIHNAVVAESTAIFTEELDTLAGRRAWFGRRVELGYPVLVADDGSGGVAGFASFGPFRDWPGFASTVEHSVHVRADRRGHGVGTALVEEMLRDAEALGKHAVVAGIDADNAGSIALHRRLGFVEVARMPEVARKWDRWLTLVLLQHTFGGRAR